MRIIYDIGANNGCNIPYYFMRSDKVVAVEANPKLCEKMKTRFEAEIKSGRLVIENCVVTEDESRGSRKFYVHHHLDVLSQCDSPPAGKENEFYQLDIPAKSIVGIIETHGTPYYVKIDVEHYDARLLRALFMAKIIPPFVSAECHELDVLAVLVERGGYRAFKIVDGPSVPIIYKSIQLACYGKNERCEHSFPAQSAGPFGDDIFGPWVSSEEIVKQLGFGGLGWKDIHASTIMKPDPHSKTDILQYLDRLVSWAALVQYLLKRTWRSLIRRIPIINRTAG